MEGIWAPLPAQGFRAPLGSGHISVALSRAQPPRAARLGRSARVHGFRLYAYFRSTRGRRQPRAAAAALHRPALHICKLALAQGLTRLSQNSKREVTTRETGTRTWCMVQGKVHGPEANAQSPSSAVQLALREAPARWRPRSGQRHASSPHDAPLGGFGFFQCLLHCGFRRCAGRGTMQADRFKRG